MISEPLKYENGDLIELKIDYQTEIVKFLNGTICGKAYMYLKEFAISVLGIEPESKEFVAVFIGKEITQAYKKNHKYYILSQTKSKKNIFEGTIQKNYKR